MDPVAWLHIMHMEEGQEQKRLSFNSENPWGEPGRNYSEEYTVTSKALFAPSPASVDAVAVSRMDVVIALREWFGGERYARDYEYLDMQMSPQMKAVLEAVFKDRCERASLTPPSPQAPEAGEPVAKRWLVEEHLPSGSIRWSCYEHERMARDEAKSFKNPTTVTPLYATPAPEPAGNVVREALRELHDRAHDFGTFAIDDDHGDPLAAWDASVVPALVKARAALLSPASAASEQTIATFQNGTSMARVMAVPGKNIDTGHVVVQRSKDAGRTWGQTKTIWSEVDMKLLPASIPSGSFTISHDGFSGSVQGHYITREGKRGVVLQQHGTRVVHVYGEKWLEKQS